MSLYACGRYVRITSICQKFTDILPLAKHLAWHFGKCRLSAPITGEPHWQNRKRNRSHAVGLCCVCVFTHVCVPVCGGHMFAWGVFHSHLPHYPLRQGLSQNRVHQEATLASQWAQGTFLSPLHQHSLPCLSFCVSAMSSGLGCGHSTHWAMCRSSRLCFDLLLCKTSNHRGRK